jgi:hypothetical protein
MAAHQPDIRCAARLLAGPGAHFTARLREGTATSGRSAGRFATQTSNRTRRAGASGPLTLRADSGF